MGPRTKRRRNKRTSVDYIPRALTSHSLVKLKAQFQIPGYIQVAAGGSSTPRSVQSLYRPIKVIATNKTVDGVQAQWAHRFQWNDGILTGTYSHYLQYPMESTSTDGTGRPNLSNMMLGGSQLWGGSIIGTGWNDYTTRLNPVNQSSLTQDAKNVVLKDQSVISVEGTKRLYLHSYAVHLKETPWCQGTIVNGQAGFPQTRDSLYRSFLLYGKSEDSAVPYAGIGATPTTSGTGTMELRAMLHKQARVKVRNIIIRLPPEPINQSTLESNLSNVGVYNALIDQGASTTSTWQTTVWNIIKEDFMLVGDYTYGEPPQTNAALKARINPKYTVLKDFTTTIGMSPEPGDRAYSRQLHFTHGFSTRHPTTHDEASAETVFSDNPTTDDMAIFQTTNTNESSSTAHQLDQKPETLQFSTPAKRPRPNPANAASKDLDEGQQYDADMEMDASTADIFQVPTLKGKLEFSNASPTSMNVLLPRSNRIVWIRIPRMEDPTIELSDLIAGNYGYPYGYIDAAAGNPYGHKNVLLSALTQLCTTMEGSSTYKFIQPQVMGIGSAVGPLTPDQGTWGTDDKPTGDGGTS